MENKKSSEEKYNLKENRKRQKLMTTIGFVVLIVGIILLLIGTISFFTGNTSVFFLNFIAIPLIFTGLVLITIFNSGKIARFHARQHMPVKRDMTNYMLDETGDNIASIINKSKNSDTPKRSCLKCGYINDANNNFCSDCGAKMNIKGD